ncbi:MAG: S-layer homology domain-containing protein, partial [Oscillospiraceae bacterium]
REALAWAYETGIVRGTSGSRINPAGFATRAETAAMLHRYLKK